jgi:transposase-like protein
MVKVLSEQRRRQMILEAFGPEANISKIARQYGMNRNTLHEHINRAVRDPEGGPRREAPGGGELQEEGVRAVALGPEGGDLGARCDTSV